MQFGWNIWRSQRQHSSADELWLYRFFVKQFAPFFKELLVLRWLIYTRDVYLFIIRLPIEKKVNKFCLCKQLQLAETQKSYVAINMSAELQKKHNPNVKID